MENVKGLVQKKFMPGFQLWLDFLSSIGYETKWQVLNAKNYGIAQNRERVFAVSVLGENNFTFPEPIPLTTRLKDYLEDDVDSKYYLSETHLERFINNNPKINILDHVVGNYHKDNNPDKQRYRVVSSESYMKCLTATDYKTPPAILIVGHNAEEGNEHQTSGIYSSDGISPTLKATDYKSPTKVLNVVNVNPSGNGMNGSVYSDDGLCPTLTTNKGEGPKIIKTFIGNREYSFEDENTVYDQEGVSPTIRVGGSPYKVSVPCRIVGRNPDNPSDRATGAHTEQRLECKDDSISGTITTVTKDTMVTELRLLGRLDNETFGNFDQNLRVYDVNGLAPTMNTFQGGNTQPKIGLFKNDEFVCAFSIRRMTAKESGRLMGVSDEDIDKIKNCVVEVRKNGKPRYISESAQYKLFGNSIVVDVLEHIFRNMFLTTESEELVLNDNAPHDGQLSLNL